MQPSRRYWSLAADPRRYRVLDAIQDRETDLWTTKGKPIQRGDRVAIWKYRGRDRERGVVALGEVLTDPDFLPDADNHFWVVAPAPDEREDRVLIRYVRSPRLPLRYSDQTKPVLDQLVISRVQGGTVYEITPDQWDVLLEAIGGWPEPGASSDIVDVQAFIDTAAGRRVTSSGQGFPMSPDLRKAVEDYAMAHDTAHYRAQGWAVVDVSRNTSYDLHCTRQGQVLHVEVKGRTSSGSQILLTPNEVEHARQAHPNVSLYIVANVTVVDATTVPPKVNGGTTTIIEPWLIQEHALTPLGFAYSIEPR